MNTFDAPKSGEMMQHSLRVALVGAGGFGSNHVRMLERLQLEGLVEFRAVADPSEAALSDVKARLGMAGVRWFTDYRALLDTLGGELDAVVISTPIPLHLPMLEAALDRNLFIFLEKPPVPLVQDLLRLSARPEASRVAVGFKLLADPHLWRLKEAVVRGTFGRIVSLRASACWPRLDSYYARAGWAGRMMWRDLPVFDGPATNALAHIVHNIMFLAGPERDGFGVPGEVRGELYRARPIESYDVCGLTGKFPNGPAFSAAFSHAVEKRLEWSIVVEGESGRAVLTKDGVESDRALPDAAPLQNEIFEESWLDFYRFASGRQSRPHTRLEDCRGYVAATNAMLISSGGIRDLPEGIVRRFERSDDGGYDVQGVAELVLKTQKTGCSFAGGGSPWAGDGAVVDADGLTSIDFVRYALEAGCPAV